MPSASVPPPSAAGVLTADTSEDPDSWLRIVSWIVIVFSLAQILVFSFGRDQGIYAMVADGILEGQLPYRDRWDFKPPGIFFVYATAFGLFGKSMIAPRLLEVALVLGAALGLRRLGGVLFDNRTAGIMGAACYALIHAQMDFWHSGQPESFAGPLTVFALVLAVGDWPKRRWIFAYLGIGFLFGCAFLLKPPFGGGAIVCAYYLCSQRRADGRSWWSALLPLRWIGLSSVIPIAACWLWFSARGGHSALVWTLFEFAPGYTALSWKGHEAGSMFFQTMSEGFFGLSSLLALGTVALASIHPRADREREALLLLLGVLGFQFVGIAIQGKFFQYHFGASLPLLGLMAGQGYYKLWRRLGPGSPSSVLAYGAFMVIAATMKLPVDDTPEGFWKRSVIRAQYLLSGGRSISREELDERLHYVAGYNLSVARQVAHEITHLTGPNDPIYIWGFEPIIYWLSERSPSSSAIYNVPQRASWQADKAWSRLWSDLKARPPQLIAIQSLDVIPHVTGNPLDSADSLPTFPAFESYIHEHYEQVKTIDRFSLWVRRAAAREVPEPHASSLDAPQEETINQRLSEVAPPQPSSPPRHVDPEPECSSSADCFGPRSADCVVARCVAERCVYDRGRCECTEDQQCDDNDTCTRDLCYARTNKCVHIKEGCAESPTP